MNRKMKVLTTVISAAVAATTFAAGANAVDLTTSSQARANQIVPSQKFRDSFVTPGVNKAITPGGLTAKEPFVKEAHPRGPTWVNSPRGVDQLGGVTVNPSTNTNVLKSFERNIGVMPK